MDAAQGALAIRVVGSRLAVPIHYDDYDVFRSPLEDFVRAVREAGLERRVYYVNRGDTFDFDVGDLRRSFTIPPRAPLPPRRSRLREALPAVAVVGGGAARRGGVLALAAPDPLTRRGARVFSPAGPARAG